MKFRDMIKYQLMIIMIADIVFFIAGTIVNVKFSFVLYESAVFLFAGLLIAAATSAIVLSFMLVVDWIIRKFLHIYNERE